MHAIYVFKAIILFYNVIMSKITLILLLSCALSCVSCVLNTSQTTQSSPYRIAPETWNNADAQHIKLRGTIRLPHHWLNGVNVTELSGIAWDETEKVLYAINDRGSLFHLKLTFEHGLLTMPKSSKPLNYVINGVKNSKI